MPALRALAGRHPARAIPITPPDGTTQEKGIMMFPRIKFLPLVFLILCGCSETVEYTSPLSLTSYLSDQGTLKVSITVEFEDQKGLDELAAKEKRIKRAFSLVFREYDREKLKSGKTTVSKIMKKIFASQLKSRVVKFNIDKYSVLYKNSN